MSEYIEREALTAEMQHPKIEINDGQDFADWYSHCVRTVPAADVAPIVHGRWIYKGKSVDGKKVFECSACHAEIYATGNYCKECGAKMDAESEAGK